MDANVLNALIGAVALVLGGSITGIVSTVVARQKIREIKISFNQRMHENYLANARLYTNGIYVPLNIALSKLAQQYSEFRLNIAPIKEQTPCDVETKFRTGCLDFDAEISRMIDRGADSFLTTDLEENLRSFRNFIKASLDANQPRYKIMVQYRLKFPGLLSSFSTERTVLAEMSKMWSHSSMRIDFLGIGFTYRINEMVAASIMSQEFEQRMVSDIAALKVLIKEVTLGSHVKDIDKSI